MQEIKNIKGNKFKIFSDTVGYDVINQVKAMANYGPYQDCRIRIMPDAHVGKGCTIGTTIELNDAVTPNLVGVDIGCGMTFMKFSNALSKDSLPQLTELDKVIRKYVPSGREIHQESPIRFDISGLKCIKEINTSRADKSIGTLGGGNHFIELSASEEDPNIMYLIVHSGSRNLGVQVCNYYQDLAWKKLNEMGTIKSDIVAKLKSEGRHSEIETELKKVKKPKGIKSLANLTGVDFDNYLHDIDIVQRYASWNRKEIIRIICNKMNWRPGKTHETIHNYIDLNRNILRKGAVSAEEGELLLIPINMRDGSLLCKGKGNPDWNYSAPHGAGRIYSRSEAKKVLNTDDFKNDMSSVFTTCVGENTLDESPRVYKPMQEIKEAIQDTVEVLDTLTPIYNFKDSKEA